MAKDSGNGELRAEVAVIGAGPGGYTAAFRAADLGKRVVLVERYPDLGGVCLNVGCIPSKTLLHVAEGLHAAMGLRDFGVDFGEPEIDLERLRAKRDEVVGGLVRGLAQMAKRRGVEVVTGTARFRDAHRFEIDTPDGPRGLTFDHAILAVGSRAVRLPGMPDDPRVLDSTSALALEDVPERLLVVGGGIIGLEMASVYDALGSSVSVVELEAELMPGVDADLRRPLERRLAKQYEALWTGTRVTGVEARDDGLHVSLEGPKAPERERFDRVLVAVGRRPNGDRVGAEVAGLEVDERGFVPVDARRRTNLEHVHAIGDVTPGPMLAHKASHEGRVAAEVIAGEPAAFDPRAIPSVAYTDPEVAWAGLTETEAAARGVEVEVARFPWSASGRALGAGRAEGLTKLVVEPGTGRLLGGGAVGIHAGELIAEIVLALEFGADAEDVALTIHPHPTLSESVGLAAEVAGGTVTDLYLPKRGKDRKASR